jgi:hypothetical protein
MIKHKIDNISTGGGCEHIWITFQDLDLGVLINNDWTKVPEQGESFDIGVYHIDHDTIDGMECIGDHIEGHFTTFQNFDLGNIVPFIYGYLLAKGFTPKEPTYNVEDLFQSVNDIYSQLDSGEINNKEAKELMLNCAKEFVKENA